MHVEDVGTASNETLMYTVPAGVEVAETALMYTGADVHRGTGSHHDRGLRENTTFRQTCSLTRCYQAVFIRMVLSKRRSES
jgi:hypothetical protein